MKISMILASAMLCALAASAQTFPAVSQPEAQATAASSAAQSITLSGCVGSINHSATEFMLSNPAVVPTAAQPGMPTTNALPSPLSASTATNPPTAAAGAGAQTKPSIDGYHLSGVNMNAWSGRRVQVVGVVVPLPTPGSPASGAVVTSGTTGQVLPEFRVQSVQPIIGDCLQP